MDLNTRIVITTKDQTKAGNASVKGGLKGIDDQLNQLRRNVKAAFSIGAAVLLTKALGRTADEYKEVSARIKLATDNQQEYNQAQNELLAISQRTRTSLAVNAELYNRVNRSVESLGGTQQRSLRLTELINKATKIGGESAQTASQAIRQFNQGIASGVLRGEEYNSVLEGSTRLAQALADGLGVDIGRLREMAEAGELTSARVLAAVESQAELLDQEFIDVPLKIGDAWQIAENGFLAYIGRVDEMSGASSTVAQSIKFIGENVKELIETLLHVGAIFLTVYGAKKVAVLKTFITTQMAAVAASKAEIAATAAVNAAKLRQAQINLSLIQSKIVDLRTSQKMAQSDAARLAIIKQLSLAMAKEAAALKVLETAEKSYIATTTVATRVTKFLGKALNGLVVGAVIYQAIEILREWSTEFDLWAITVESAINKVATTWAHFYLGDFLDSDATPLEEKLTAIDDKFSEMFINAKNGTVSATDRANAAFGGLGAKGDSTADKLAEAFKKVKQTIEGNAESQKIVLDRQLSNLDLFASEVAGKFERAYSSEVDVSRANEQMLLVINQQKITAITEHYAEQISIIEAAYGKEIKATKQKNLSVEGLENDLANAKKSNFIEVEKALADSVATLLEIERGHLEKAKSYVSQRLEFERQAAKNLRDLTIGSESDTQANLRRQQERLALSKQLASAEAEFKKKNFGEALEQYQKINEALLENAREEKNAAEEGRSYSLSAIEARKLYEKSVEGVSETLVELEKQEKIAAESAAEQREQQVQQLTNVQDVLTEIDEKLAKAQQLNIDVDSSQVDAVIEQINAIPTNKTVTITTRNVQANQTGGPIFGFNTGGYLPREGQLGGYGGGDKVKALLEPGEFIIRKEAVAAYGQRFMQRINAIKEPIKRRLGGIVPRFAVGGLVSSSSSSVGTVNVTGGRIGLKLNIQPDELNEALFTLEEKIQDQIDDAQQRFNESALQATEQAGELTSRTLERFTTDITRIQKDAVNFSESIDDRIRRIKQAGFTEEERRVDIIKQIREKQAAAEQAIAEGDVERAARLNAELITLAESISAESRDAAGNIIVDQQTAANQAINFLRQAQQINLQITAEKKNQTETAKQAELAAIALEKSTKLAAIEAELQAKLAAIETAKKAELATTSSTSQTALNSSSSLISRSTGNGSADSGVADVSGTGVTQDTATIQRQIDLIKSNLSNFSTFGITARQSDLLKRLNGLYDQLKQTKGFNAGGSVPGQGDGDTVPAMLTPGEWVMNKLSVQKYGAGFMDAVNRGVLPIQKFASGGQVSNVRESISVSLSLGSASSQGQFPADDSTRALIAELQDAGLVT